MDLDDLFQQMEEDPSALQSNPLETIGLSRDFFLSDLIDSPTRHAIALDHAKAVLSMLHPDRTQQRDAGRDQLFRDVSDARSTVQEKAAFTPWEHALINSDDRLISQFRQLKETSSERYEYSEDLREAFAAIVFQHSIAPLQNLKLQLVPIAAMSQAIDDSEGRYQLEREQLIDDACKKRLEALNEERILPHIEMVIEEQLTDLRLRVGKQRYLKDNPAIAKKMSGQAKAELDSAVFEHYFKSITEADLDQKSIRAAAEKAQKAAGEYLFNLPPHELEQITQKFSRHETDSSESDSKAVLQRQRGVTIAENGFLQGQLPEQNVALLGFIVGPTEEELDNQIIHQCGYSLEGNTKYDPDRLDPEVKLALLSLGRLGDVQKNGFTKADRMAVEHCGPIFRELVTDLAHPELLDNLTYPAIGRYIYPVFHCVANGTAYLSINSRCIGISEATK